MDGGRLERALAEAKADWPLSRFIEDAAATLPYADAAFGQRRGTEPLRLFAKGTPFQIQVWRALMRIPDGSAVSYGELAAELGRPGSGRAVGRACGANRIGVLIPCHRVLARDRCAGRLSVGCRAQAGGAGLGRLACALGPAMALAG